MPRLCSISIALFLSSWLMLPGPAAAERWRQDPNVGWNHTGCCCCGGQFHFQYGFAVPPPTFPAREAYYTPPPTQYVPPPVVFQPRPPSLGAALGNGCRVFNAPLGPDGLTAQGRGIACPQRNGSWRVTPP
jgi:hypothetical protein